MLTEEQNVASDLVREFAEWRKTHLAKPKRERLRIIVQGGKRGVIRSNGMFCAVREDKNRFLYPGEYLKFEGQLKAKQKFSVKFLINTGARINEARNVAVEDCDLERNVVNLKHTKAKAKKGEVKGQGKPRSIPISSQFAKYLRHEIKEKALQMPDKLPILSNGALNQAYKKAGLKAGIKDFLNISSHTFRKTLECWLMALGVHDLALTAHLGHDIKTAASNYVSPAVFSRQDLQDMRLIIGDLYQEMYRR